MKTYYFAAFAINGEFCQTPPTDSEHEAKISARNIAQTGKNVTIWECRQSAGEAALSTAIAEIKRISDAENAEILAGKTLTFPNVTADEIKTFVRDNYPRIVLENLTCYAENGDLEMAFKNAGYKTPLNANVRAGAEQDTLTEAERVYGHRGFTGRGRVKLLEGLTEVFDSVDLTATIAQAWRINKSAQEGEN